MASNFTPRGAARYPKTDKPYTYNKATKKSVPDPNGKFSLEVVYDAAKVEGIIADIKAVAREAGLKLPSVKNWPFKDELDKDTDEPTGRVILKFSQHGKSKDGDARRIGHFDAKGKPLPKSFKLTSGSEVIVGYRSRAFKELGGGVSLYLDGVQVTKYVERDGNPGFAATEGFAYEDDGDDVANDETEDTGFRNAEADAEDTNEDPTDF